MKKMSLNSPGSIPLTSQRKDAALSAQIEKDAWFSLCGIKTVRGKKLSYERNKRLGKSQQQQSVAEEAPR